MGWLDLSLASIFENLALDEALLLAAEAGAGGEVLRVWEQPNLAAVLGASGALRQDVDVAACGADAIAIARRATGGGTVLLGPGCLCFSLVLDMEKRRELRGVNGSYRRIMEAAAKAISAALVPCRQSPAAPTAEVRLAGSSDLALSERKCSGNAQKRLRRFLLHHGTLLCDFDLSLLGRYLKHPKKQPDYRRDRPHEAFVANLPCTAAALKESLRTIWGAGDPLTHPPLDEATRLALQRYRKAEWTERF